MQCGIILSQTDILASGLIIAQLILSQQWSNALDGGYELRLIAFDFKGTFDKVWNKGPCFKLKEKGISGKLAGLD